MPRCSSGSWSIAPPVREPGSRPVRRWRASSECWEGAERPALWRGVERPCVGSRATVGGDRAASSGARVGSRTTVGGDRTARENGIAWGPRLKLGHITPSCNSVLETMTVSMSTAVADRVSHHFTRIPVTNISLSDQDLSQFAVEPMLNAAGLLADARTDAILWNGTSGAWNGLEADEEIVIGSRASLACRPRRRRSPRSRR